MNVVQVDPIRKKIDSVRTDILELMLGCTEESEGWRTGRSILNVLDWITDADPDTPLMIIVEG